MQETIDKLKEELQQSDLKQPKLDQIREILKPNITTFMDEDKEIFVFVIDNAALFDTCMKSAIVFLAGQLLLHVPTKVVSAMKIKYGKMGTW